MGNLCLLPTPGAKEYLTKSSPLCGTHFQKAKASWHEHPSRTAVFVGPCAHELIQAVDPAQCELLHHVGVPCIQHLMNFPEVILKGWALA